jgi:hypothetical protein
MSTDHPSPHPSGGSETGNGGLQIDRRGLLLAAGATVGLNVAAPLGAQAAAVSPGARIDAHTARILKLT